MALNAAMLTATLPPNPVPLPDEQFVTTIAGVEAVLAPSSSSSKSAMGQVSISNKRIVFVSYTAASMDTAAMSADSEHTLKSISINLTNFRDAKLVQPWFAANYYEATVVPQRDGGLHSIHTLKLHFKEGRAFEFHTSLETVMNAAAARQKQLEVANTLPIYTAPRNDASQSIPHSAQTEPTQDLPPAYDAQ